MAKKISYNEKTKEDLIKTLGEKRGILHDMRFGTAGSKQKNVKAERNTKKDIARVLTALNSK